MSTQRRLELHPFVPYVDASHICKHCDGGEYAACHDTKEQPMSNTLMEEEDQMSDFQPNHSCSDPACPCQEWFTRPMPVIEHEPAARGEGDEWRVQVAGANVYILDQNGDAIANLHNERIAREIIQRREQHQSLVAERERLRVALRRLSITGRGALPVDEYRDWVKEVADEALGDQKGGPQ